MEKLRVTITSTRGIMHLVDNANGREMSVDKEALSRAIKTDGRHMLYSSEFISNDTIRTQWYVQLEGTDDPADIWLDIDKDKIHEVGTVVELDVTKDCYKNQGGA